MSDDSQSTVARFPTIGPHLIDRNNPAFAETTPPAAARNWHAEFDAAMAANLAQPAMTGADPLTECLAGQALAFTYARERARPEPNATGIAGPVIVPVGRVARWWLAFRRWI